METRNRRLIWHGMFLFLLGLVTGLLEQRFTNMRMGIAAHLEGVMNGTFLVALGAIWSEDRLASPAKPTAYWGTLYATYANWMFTTLAAVPNPGAKMEILGEGHSLRPGGLSDRDWNGAQGLHIESADVTDG
jgi:(hydroxyamino)benzene mutase